MKKSSVLFAFAVAVVIGVCVDVRAFGWAAYFAASLIVFLLDETVKSIKFER